MPIPSTDIDSTSDTYPANLEVQSAAVAALNEQLELAATGGGTRYVKRHHDRGRLLARGRIESMFCSQIRSHSRPPGRSGWRVRSRGNR